MSTVAEMITEVGEYGFSDYSATRLLNQINNSYWDICSREPWPFLEKEINLSFDGISATPSNVPADLSAVLKVTNVTTGLRVLPIRLDDLEDNYALQVTQVGTPFVYYFLGTTLKFTPIPTTAVSTWRLKYLAYGNTLTAVSAEAALLIPARHHESVVFGALARLSAMEDDYQGATFFEQKLEKKLAMMREDIWRNNYETDFIHQVEDYDYYYIG